MTIVTAFDPCPGPVSLSAFSRNGSIFAYAVSYDWLKGHSGNTPGHPNKLMLHPAHAAVLARCTTANCHLHFLTASGAYSDDKHLETMGPMHVLRCGPLARVVCHHAWQHTGGLGRARSRAGICSLCACISICAVQKGRKEGSSFCVFTLPFLHAKSWLVPVRGLHIDVACPRATVMCASSGS
jgi:hypothetical protein